MCHILLLAREEKVIFPHLKHFFFLIQVVMEQAPESLDDLQPQDLSTSSISTLIDSTRESEECVSSNTSLNTLVKSPGWCPNSANSNPQLTFSESAGSSDINIQSGDQIHPDNALSHTTVTLSYVSRSHVCITQNSLSQHSPLSSLPAISKLPLCSLHNSEALRELNQHCLEPVDLDIPKEHFQSSQAQLGSENNVPAKESHEVKSKIISREFDEAFQKENSLSLKNSGLENGEVVSWESPAVYLQPSPETLVPATGDDEKPGGCAVFVVSKKPDPVVFPDSIGVRDLCLLNRDYISPLEDPLSPSVISQDGTEDGFDLAQASSLPSNCYPDTMGGFVWDGSSSKSANQVSPRLTATRGSDSSDRDEQPVLKQNPTLEPLIGVTGNVCMSDDSEKKPVNVHVNGNATALQRTLNEKKLPVRSGRGTRLEAIVMNINSSSYKVAGCISTKKRPNPSRVAKCDTKITNSEDTGQVSLRKRTSKDKASLLENSLKQTVIPVKEGKDNNCNTDSNKDSTSDTLNNHSEKPQNSTPPEFPQPAVHTNLKKPPEQLSSLDPAMEMYVARVSPRIQSPKSPKKTRGKAGGNLAPAAARKTTCSPRSRGKKHKERKHSQCIFMFSPKEPEIKLKYVTYKEEKRDLRMDSFSPFVHVEHQQFSPSLCTIVNYPEEVRTNLKKGQQLPSGNFVTGAVPSTSCLQLGRASVHSQHQRSLVCCLCGQSANTMDLGDLHGPYYPEGYQPAAKRPAGIPALKGEEDDSDSDSSSSTIKERGRKRTVKQPSHRLRVGAQPWADDGTSSPAAKRAHSDRDAVMIEDWYSPPMLPLEPCEYWLHEDCGIWSAGVYLVKGKVYGLEEAVRVAQETVMLHFCTFVWLDSQHMDILSAVGAKYYTHGLIRSC